MTLKLWQGSYKVSLLGVLAFCSTLVSTLNDSAFAQIVPDNTLGNESSSVNPDGNVKGEDATLIEGGARRDVNLLQSFSQFNVGNGQRVYFANPDGIKNILTRVTGNNVSNIFGTLGVDGNANLFLLNPNGIVFGQNARLDVAGSFLATTADSFDFGNGLEFSATDPQAAPLLSVNVTPGLQYGANPGDISSRANLIEGKELTLAGGNLDLQGEFRVSEGLILQAQDTAKVGEISAFGNSLSIEAGNKIETTGQINTSINDGKGGDIKLTSGAGGIDTRAGIVDAGSDSGEGGDITLTADGDITTATVASSISEGGIGNAGDVTINSTSGKFSLTGNEITSSASSGESGDIKITADSVSLDNARLFTEVLEGGTAGSVSVTANQSISLANESYIATGSRPFLLDFLFGGGSGGDIKLEAKSIDLKDKSRLETNSWSGGNAGNVQIKTQELTIKGGSGVLSQTFGAGRAGNVKVKYLNDKASSSVTISGVAPFAKDEQNNDIILDNDGNLTGGFSSGLFASTENQLDEDATGNGGNIDVETGHLKIQDGAAISARSRSSGNAGIIDINVDKLDITGGGQILTPALSSGKGGDINVTASGDINISGSDTEYGNRFQAIQDAFEEQGLTREDAFERTQFIVYTLGDTSSDDFDDIFLDIFGETSEVGTGFASSGLLSSSSDMGKDSGNINITSTNGSIFLRNNSEINTDIRGVGKAGNIIIEAKNGQVSFDGLYRDKDGNPILVDDLEYFIGSRVFSSLLSNAEGASGDINIEARSLDLKNRAIVDTSTFGKGKGGDINITTGSLSLDNEARLLTRTFGLASTNEQGEITSLADAGNITVNVTDKLEVLGGSQFRSDTEGQGNGGNVTVNAENAIVSFDG
ncbi:MAG: filamentous hemagglutinin N-terminal domain-containing protein, partial [Cyanobacteria bacterium P01_D01_bin.116]